MKYNDDRLKASVEFQTLNMPFATYCSLSDCQTLIKPGELVKKFDGATYIHHHCPKNSTYRNYAPHKHPNTGMRISG